MDLMVTVEMILALEARNAVTAAGKCTEEMPLGTVDAVVASEILVV